jgi:DNA modification methylase
VSARNAFLHRIAAELQREIAAVKKIDCGFVSRDIAARRREATIGRRWSVVRARIQRELERQSLSEPDWTKKELGCDITTMRRRVQLAKGWKQYEPARLAAGDNGQYGLLYALSLIRAEPAECATSAHRWPQRMRVHSADETSDRLDTSRCEFITGDALLELRKTRTGLVNAVICSPPYWPVKRWYGGSGIGFEQTLAEYLANLVATFAEARRVLKDDGVLWIVIGDSYATNGGRWKADGYKENRPDQKRLMPKSASYPGGDRSPGSLLMIPARLALALQDDGWLLRQEVIWDKGWVRPESARDRVTRTHDTLFMFAKGKPYFYDQDPLREALVRPYTTPGRQKPGLMRRDANRDRRIISNPMGRNSGSVWRVQRGNYQGAHTATFPPELVRRMIVSSCDDNSLVLDVFGGAATTALVAVQLGHRAITIDINPDFTLEAEHRLAAAPARFAGSAQTDDGPAIDHPGSTTTVERLDMTLAAD